jgi:hypothetical protein
MLKGLDTHGQDRHGALGSGQTRHTLGIADKMLQLERKRCLPRWSEPQAAPWIGTQPFYGFVRHRSPRVTWTLFFPHGSRSRPRYRHCENIYPQDEAGWDIRADRQEMLRQGEALPRPLRQP